MMQRVDPLTMEPLPEFEPMPMGDWFWGQPSSDGRYFAATVSHDNGLNEVRLIDVEGWQAVDSWPEYADSEILVTDDATLYFLSGEQVRRVRPGDPNSQLVAELPSGFSSWAGSDAPVDGKFGLIGTRMLGTDGAQETFISIVDLATGEVREIELPEVRIGPIDPISESPWARYLYTSPSFSWDHTRNRVLAIHGDEDVVSEVDLGSGALTEHTFAGLGADSSTGARWSVLSPDGRFLYVSNTEVTIVEDDDWSVTNTPAGVVAIDTNTLGSGDPDRCADLGDSPLPCR